MDKRHLWQECMTTARGAQEYFEDLNLNIDQLRGKKILDIGAGLNELANELKSENLDIVSFDPFYSLSREEREEKYKRGYEDGPEKLDGLLNNLELKDKSAQLVAGISEALPFADNSFDLIISHYGSPFYSEDAEKIEQFFSELIRVLNSGGEARIYPTWLQDPDMQKSTVLKKTLENLKNNGIRIEQIGATWILKKD